MNDIIKVDKWRLQSAAKYKKGCKMDSLKGICRRYRIYGALAVLLIFMSAVTGICNQLSVGEVTRFACFQFFCILFPGAAVMMLMPVKNLRSVEKLLLTYVSGYIFTLLVYMAVMITAGREYVRGVFILTAVMAGAVIWIKWRNKKPLTEAPVEEPDGGIWIWTALAVFVISLFGFSLRWKAPYAAGINYYEDDFLFWAGDIVALTKKVPPVNFRDLNPDYRYHYLGAMQQAVISNVTGITAVKTAACFSYIESVIFVALSTCAIAGRMIKNRTVQILTVLLMLFSTGYEIHMGPTYIWHMYLLPMSYNIAQSLGLTVVLLLLIQLRNDRIDKRNLILCLFCLIFCAGTKSAAGAVIICGFLLTYLYVFFSKTSKKTAYITLGSMLGIFVVLGLYLWPTVKAYQIAIRVPRIYLRTGEGIAQSVYACIDWVLGYVDEIVKMNFWTFVPAVLYGIYLIVHKNIEREDTLLLGIIAIGTMGGYFFGFYGYSQMYFTLITFPFAGLMAGRCAEKIFSAYMTKKLQYAAAGLISVFVIFFTLCANYKGYFQRFIAIGWENIDVPEVAEEGDVIFPVTQAECEAYCWINENTEQDAFLLSDRTLDDLRDPIGIFAERYVYCYAGDDAKKHGRACFEGDQEMIEMYAEQGINYIVQTKERSPKFKCPNNLGELVFENEEVAVYEMR